MTKPQAAALDPTPDASKPHMVGYARVSMSDQNPQRQIDELVRFGVDPRDVFTDSASGKNMKRPGWQALWRDAREGDLLVVLAIDRLGRNLVEVVQTVEAMVKRGIGLKVLTMDIDTRTPTGRLMLHLVAAMAEWERALIVERTQHGLDKARDRGVIGGRPQKITREMTDAAIARVNAGETVLNIAAEYEVHRNSLQRRMESRRKAIREGRA